MKFGLFAINYGTCADPEVAVRVAQHAEAAGLESVWTGEHIVLPDPQPPGLPFPPTLEFLDTIVALTLVAAETTTINVASGIIELPLHQPVLLAKQLTGVDHVAGGRLIVGIGAGYIEAELAALGVTLDERGGRTDEYLDAMRALWAMPRPEFHGRFVEFSGVNAYPRPTRPGGPPIVVGGVSAPARRRAIAKGDGWYLFNTSTATAAEAIQVIADEQQRYGRPEGLGPLEITMTPARFDAERAARYAELGVDRLVVLPGLDVPGDRRHEPVPLDDILRTIDTLAEVSARI